MDVDVTLAEGEKKFVNDSNNVASTAQSHTINANAKRSRTVSEHVMNDKITTITNAINNTGLSNNRYAILADIDIQTDNDSEKGSYVANNCSAKVNNYNKENEILNNTASPNNFTTAFCPPIVLFKVKINELIAQLKSKTPPVVFKILNVSKQKSKIFFKDINAHREFMLLLKDKKIDSYSFTPKQDKQINLILRGLHLDSDPADILMELNTIVPSAVESVKRFNTSYSKKHNINTGLMLVTLKLGTSPLDITKIKAINYQRVTWEKPNAVKKEVQCKNCQYWGHLAKNCNRQYQCVKCNQRHGPGACAKPKSDETEAFCVNCQTWGHPANWRGCPAYQSFLNFKSKNNVNNNISSTALRNVNLATGNTSKLVQGKTFAGLFHNQNNSNRSFHEAKKFSSSIVDDFLKVAEELLKPKFSLEDRIINFMENFKSLPRDVAIDQCQELLMQIKSHYGN